MTSVMIFSILIISLVFKSAQTIGITKDGQLDDGYNLFWDQQLTRESARSAYSEITRKYMNTTVDPCDDFYAYSCGNWKFFNPVLVEGEDHNTFSVYRNRLHITLKDLLEYNDDGNLTQAEIKAKMLYRSCLNNTARENRSVEPALNMLRTFNGWPSGGRSISPPDNFDWLNLTAHMEHLGRGALFSEAIEINMYNPSEYITAIGTDSFMFKEVSVNHYESSVFGFKRKIKRFVSNILEEYGFHRREIARLLTDVANFEAKLVKILKRTAPAQEYQHYEKMSIESFNALLPSIDFQRYLSIVQGRDVKLTEEIVVKNLEYMKALSDLIKVTSKKTIGKYLLVRLAVSLFSFLDGKKSDAVYTVIYNSGPLWIDCLAQQQEDIRNVLGALYVRRYFSKSKDDVLAMIDELKEAFKEIVGENDWLDRTTKRIIREKVNSMTVQIGYPDDLFENIEAEYQNVVIDPEKFFETSIDLLRHQKFHARHNLNRFAHVNYELLDPINTNAYYDAQNKNQMVYPASVLQPPFYNHFFPKWANFGGMGAIMGHEISHAFDVDNANIDANGNERNGMNFFTFLQYLSVIGCFVGQYNDYSFPNVEKPVNGVSTLSENLSDNTGLKIAYKAYKNWLNKNPEYDESEQLAGLNLTYTQHFFVSYAQNWCDATDPGTILNNIENDEHAPEKFRVIGVLTNSKDFTEEFQCPAGSKMNPVEKCSYI